MVTDQQKQARRNNARLSRGAKTPAGKASSSQNAVKFGFFARNPVLPGESETEYTEFRTKLITSLNPVGAVEIMLSESIADAAWRLRRFPLVETGLFAVHFCQDQGNVASGDAIHRIFHPDEPEEGDEEDTQAAARIASNSPENALGRAFLHDSMGPGAFARLSRYEATIRRSFQRDLQELQRLQAGRPAAPEKPFLQNDLTKGLNALELVS
jgi:hypothetical protein